MAFPSIQTALNAGEFSPELFGRTDIDKYRRATSTMRNFFASYRGGAISRAGTQFIGQCVQGRWGTADTALPPRNIPFSFSQNQALCIEAGEHYFRFISLGGYVTEAAKPISHVTLGSVTQITCPAHGFLNDDEVAIAGLNGASWLNNRSFQVAAATANTFTLRSPLTGGLVNTTGYPPYVSGGTASRIYSLPTPYAAADLSLLKWAQSADVMTFTHPSYPPHDLKRFTNASWQIAPVTFSATIGPPPGIQLTGHNSGISTPSFYYQFCATAVDAKGSESIASPIATILTVDMATEAATIVIDIQGVNGATSYNYYGSPVSYNTPPVAGTLFGYVGSSFGTSFTDSNVTPDYAQGPPLHTNPFAPGAVVACPMTAAGMNYAPIYTSAGIVSATGSGAVLRAVVANNQVQWIIVESGGQGYTSADYVVITDGATGVGAAASLQIGPSTGIYPGCVAYFQQRRFYANSTTQPDTYWASQPGDFTNMDSSLPVKDDDAITGSPWSQQVNGIQWMLNMPGGLVIFTGLGAWQLSGSSGGVATAAAVTPSNQVANPQAYNGVHDHIPPIVINYDILYVQAKGSIVRDLSYNFFVNIYTGTDLTVLSNHLFMGHQIREWAWAEEPHKVVWAVRDDGKVLGLTYLKEQDVYAWSRHDTNGIFQSVAAISEPLVNAPYFIVKRLIQNHGHPIWAYYQERMDNRQWTNIEDAWCSDCALAAPLTLPNATLTVDHAAGIPTLSDPELIYGGSHYSSATYAQIVDPTGFGAEVALTIVGGVVTAVTITGNRTGYTDPSCIVIDPNQAGGNAAVFVRSEHRATITATAAVFANSQGHGEVGDVIRSGDRRMSVLQFIDARHLLVDVLDASGALIPDDPHFTARPALPGEWSISFPILEVHGLDHLEGMTVSILADGLVVQPQVVTDGAVTLPQPASRIIIGLGFEAQLQTLYLDIPGGVTVQGRRKKIWQVIARVQASATPFEVGVNQPDSSTTPDGAIVPWTEMTETREALSQDQSMQPVDLATADFVVPIEDSFGNSKGQIAVQQRNPVPLTVLALMPWSQVGDDADTG